MKNSEIIQTETDALILTIGPLQSSMLEILFCCQYNQRLFLFISRINKTPPYP